MYGDNDEVIGLERISDFFMKVFINPGHAPGIDSGAVNQNTGLQEADVALSVGLMVQKYLNDAGLETEILQSDNLAGESPEYPCVTAAANASGADLFISIHCNAANTMARGTEVEVYDNTGGPAVELAECMMDQIISSIGTVKRYINSRSGLAVLRCTSMPAILVEMAFIDNDGDCQLLTDRQDDFARAIARAVTDYQQAQS